MKNKKQETILWILIYMIICVCVAWVYVPEILANKNGFDNRLFLKNKEKEAVIPPTAKAVGILTDFL